MGPAIASGFSGLVYLHDYQQAKKYDLTVSDYRTAISDRMWTSLLFPYLFESMTLVSSGGGGSGESPTSTDSPPGLHQQGQPVPVVVPAASISAHGGRRSGSKPRRVKRKCNSYTVRGQRMMWCKKDADIAVSTTIVRKG